MPFDVVGLLSYLGITADKLGPFLIFGFIMGFYIYQNLKPINKILKRVCNAVIEVQIYLKTKGYDSIHPLVEASGSPLKPTPLGQEWIKDSGLEKILDDNKDKFISSLKKTLGNNYVEYDVQEQCRAFLVSLKDDPIMNPVKDFAYKNGVDLVTILKVGGLWLRDDFLGQPREITKGKTS